MGKLALVSSRALAAQQRAVALAVGATASGGPAVRSGSSGTAAGPRAQALAASARDALLRAAARQGITVALPGGHYSGLGAQGLLDLMASRARPIGAITPAVRAKLAADLASRFAVGLVPSRGALNSAVELSVRASILARFSGDLGDVNLRPLTARWLAYKSRHGAPATIGVFRGVLRAAAAKLTVVLS